MGEVNINLGGGFLGMLTIAFIVLKLIGQIDWSWYWVLAPILIPLGIMLIIIIFIGVWFLIEFLWG